MTELSDLAQPGAWLAVLGGALIAGCIMGLVYAMTPTPVTESAPLQQRLAGVLPSWSSRTWFLVAGGVAAGVVGWLATGWPLAMVIGPLAVVGLPRLLIDREPSRRIARLEALEEWSRSLSGVLTAGIGLEQALAATVRSAPARIAEQVGALSSRLRSGWTTQDALRAFADEMDDATGDLVAMTLMLAARRRGHGLAVVLESLAQSVADDVRSRKQVEADRAKPRATARWVTLISAAVLILLALTSNYMDPYGTPIGQVLLAVLLTSYILVLGWMKKMATGKPPARLLRVTRPAHDGVPLGTGGPS